MVELSRRTLAVATAASGLSLAGCTGAGRGGPNALSMALTPAPGQPVITHTLRPQETRIDLGGTEVDTWAFGEEVPGPLIRARPGDLVRVTVKNRLPSETVLHWHGLPIRNSAAGIPDLTQKPIASGATYRYEFIAPDPGSYLYFGDVGVQSDRGLYGSMIVDDPDGPEDYDEEWMVVLDDWIDGTGTTPDGVLAELKTGARRGVVRYPHYLLNGKTPADPAVFLGRRRDRVRMRMINAGSDTTFAVALADHPMTVTHADGFTVQPRELSAITLGPGERCDVRVDLGSGLFPLVAKPVGRPGRAKALVRTSGGRRKDCRVSATKLTRGSVGLAELLPAPSTMLPDRAPDLRETIELRGTDSAFAWEINDGPYGENTALLVDEGARVALDVSNQTATTQPFTVQGHAVALESGLRKNVVLIPSGQTQRLSLQADNPGRWRAQSQDPYRAEAGMRIGLDYRKA
jgi:multicopper oxidase